MGKTVRIDDTLYEFGDVIWLREQLRKNLILADQIDMELAKEVEVPKFAHLQQVRDKYGKIRRGVVIRGWAQREYALHAGLPNSILTVVSDQNGVGFSYVTEEAASRLWEEV